MPVTKKYIKVGDTKVFDPESIYARDLGLQLSTRTLDTDQGMCYELAPYPTSLLDETGNMRDAKSKSKSREMKKVG